jgi:deoxyribodipyrimidine photo-lyase
LHEPWTIKNKAGKPFQVFTPFWKTCLKLTPDDLVPAPRNIPAPAKWPPSARLNTLRLEPEIDWAGGLRAAWQPGPRTARRTLRSFLETTLPHYDVDRNRLDVDATSRLSPHLAFGEISPRQIWHAVTDRAEPAQKNAADVFLSEIGWREFAYHLLYHFPHTTVNPLRTQFDRFPWRRSPKAFNRWQKGTTGFPVVDAAMRQLWQTGWMPNRARMIVASFLTKDLLIPWQDGAKWFWDTLVDADLANNTLGWQWTAGCGADAAPFFRIFNPVNQAQKFDPTGDYIRRWLPEIAALTLPWLFKPWDAPTHLLRSTGIHLGTTYPKPIVDHADARTRALALHKQLRS